jgi:hypothetical protein
VIWWWSHFPRKQFLIFLLSAKNVKIEVSQFEFFLVVASIELNWSTFLFRFISFPIDEGNSTLIELCLIYLYESALSLSLSLSCVTVVAVDADCLCWG